jgi:hypothetical protein
MKETVEFIGVVLKVNGKKKTFTKEKVSFSASESECDLCGSHGSVTLNVYDGKKTLDIEVHEW